MEAARHLRPVPFPDTGEVPAEGPQSLSQALQAIAELEGDLRVKRSQITRLKNENAALMGVEPDHDDILQVMSYWRQVLAPGASVTVGSKGWTTVRARLRERDAETKAPRFSVLKLKGAIIGISLDEWHMDGSCRHRRYLENAFSEAGKVDRLLSHAVTFKRTYGTSALGIVDDLAGEGLIWLAERCACDHTWLEHLRHGGPTPDGRQPCSRCDCGSFDWFDAKLRRYELELQRRAREGDAKAVETVADIAWFEGRS